MPTPAELAQSHTELKPEELGHLQRLLGSWSVLADLSFSDLLLVVPVHAGAGQPAPRRPRAGRPGPDAPEQPAHPGRSGPGRADDQRDAVGPGRQLPAQRRDRAGQHPPPHPGRAGPGGEHPRPLRGRGDRRAAPGVAGAPQGPDEHVRADLPRRVRAAGRHGGPVRLPVSRRGRRDRGGPPGGRRRGGGRCRRAGGVRLAQRHERLSPDGYLRTARGPSLR